jgi:Stress responsive A/B Barrel Domain
LIQHTVAFRLKHADGSPDEQHFLADAMVLAKIPGVHNFQRFRQVSPKNDFRFGFSMEFTDANAYKSYNDHPDHIAFVAGRWIPEVADFLEIDYVKL